MLTFFRYALLLLLSLCAWPASSAKVNISTVEANVEGTTIPVYLYKPEGKGPFPLVVLSHGSPRNSEDRKSFGPNTMHDQARSFVYEGIAVAVPIRRGFGANGISKDLYRLNCSRPDFYDSGLADAQDIGAAIKAVTQDPQIDAGRVALIGHSAGGFASVAAATREKVLGVVGFAPGRGSLEADRVICKPQLLSAMSRYGQASHVPELWIYSRNDHFFGPALARELFNSFNQASKQATFAQAPDYGLDGHAYIEDISSWQPEVDAFLRKIGFLPQS